MPKKPFFVKDLDRRRLARNRALCRKAGVNNGPLLDACIIDVAVIGAKAAQVFVNAVNNPVAVGNAPYGNGAASAGRPLVTQ